MIAYDTVTLNRQCRCCKVEQMVTQSETEARVAWRCRECRESVFVRREGMRLDH